MSCLQARATEIRELVSTLKNEYELGSLDRVDAVAEAVYSDRPAHDGQLALPRRIP